MPPRMLSGEGCSGGTCPAVWDSAPGLPPGDLAVVGKKPAGATLASLADRVAGDETAVTISRAIVAAAVRLPDEPADLAGLMAHLKDFSWSAFRLETLQHYAGTGRDEEWEALVKGGRRFAAKTYQRVHVVTEPLSPAMRQELTEGYGPNVAAGEDIGIIATREGEWPHGVPGRDFWLLDGSALYEMDYAPDGTWLAARRVRDPERVLAACAAREAALHHAVPWHAYVASRPELQRRLAQ